MIKKLIFLSTLSRATFSSSINLEELNNCQNCEKLPQDCDLTDNSWSSSFCSAIIWESVQNGTATHFTMVSNYNEDIDSLDYGKWTAFSISNTPHMGDGDLYMCNVKSVERDPDLWLVGYKTPETTSHVHLNRLSNVHTKLNQDLTNKRTISTCEFTRPNVLKDVEQFQYSNYEINEENEFYMLIAKGSFNAFRPDAPKYHGSWRRHTETKISFFGEHGGSDFEKGTPSEEAPIPFESPASPSIPSETSPVFVSSPTDPVDVDPIPNMKCLTIAKKSKITLSTCQANNKKQIFKFNNNKIQNKKKCFQVKKSKIVMGKCKSDEGKQEFTLMADGQVQNGGKCFGLKGDDLKLGKCKAEGGSVFNFENGNIVLV